jgi:hypothetical protein
VERRRSVLFDPCREGEVPLRWVSVTTFGYAHDHCLSSAWNGSWNGALDSPSAVSVVRAITCAISAAGAYGARDGASCKQLVGVDLWALSKCPRPPPAAAFSAAQLSPAFLMAVSRILRWLTRVQACPPGIGCPLGRPESLGVEGVGDLLVNAAGFGELGDTGDEGGRGPWTDSWTESPDNSSAAGVISAVTGAIGAARASAAREHASRNA